MARERKTKSAATEEAIECVSTSAEVTERVGECIGRLLEPGMVLALHGELGSGKTTFMHGLTSGAGGDSGTVKSPTFVLVREYAARVPIIHVDGYRLSGATEAVWLDMELIFSADKITAIEWPEKFDSLLPEDRMDIWFEHLSAHRRKLKVSGTGPRSRELVAQVKPLIASELSQDSAPDGQRAA